MPSDLALKTAGKAWDVPFTAHIKREEALLHAFANILDETWSHPDLSKATKQQLLDEIALRMIEAACGSVSAYPPDPNPC